MTIKAIWEIYDGGELYLFETNMKVALGKLNLRFINKPKRRFDRDLVASMWVRKDTSSYVRVHGMTFDPPIPTAMAQMILLEQLYTYGFDVEVVG